MAQIIGLEIKKPAPTVEKPKEQVKPATVTNTVPGKKK